MSNTKLRRDLKKVYDYDDDAGCSRGLWVNTLNQASALAVLRLRKKDSKDLKFIIRITKILLMNLLKQKTMKTSTLIIGTILFTATTKLMMKKLCLNRIMWMSKFKLCQPCLSL